MFQVKCLSKSEYIKVIFNVITGCFNDTYHSAADVDQDIVM